MEIPKTMQALVLYGPQDFRLETRAVPLPGAGEVLIRVEACGICAGDVKMYRGADMFWAGDPPWVKAPVIPGHEFIGRVMALGAGAAEKYRLAPGDRVVAEQILPCGICRFCRRGQYWMCQVHRIYGFQGGTNDGGFAEYMRFAAGSLIHKVPETIAPRQGALIEPLACALHAAQRAGPGLDDVVVVAGMGPIGLCILQALRLQHPRRLAALDVRDDRLELAARLGADLTCNPAREDAVAILLALTEGYGCDVYVECSGHPQGVVQGLAMLRKLGRMVEFSVFSEATTVDWSVVGDRKELDIRGAHLGPYCYPLAIDLIAGGGIRVDDLVTHTFPLKAYAKAFQVAAAQEPGTVKVLLLPGDPA